MRLVIIFGKAVLRLQLFVSVVIESLSWLSRMNSKPALTRQNRTHAQSLVNSVVLSQPALKAHQVGDLLASLVIGRS